ncbi:unnamed protein product [Cochlearia groenlandica]
MDSVAGYGGARQARSGGKIVRKRRNAAVRTPYDRPAPRSKDLPQQNPSWISRLVYKPATLIASGAGKFISSVVFSESSSSSSDSASDIDGEEDVENNITDFTEDETMFMLSESDVCLCEYDIVNAQQPTIQRLGSKRVIEQLLMQESFAREEGDRLINLINARVVDHPSFSAAEEGRHSDNGLTSDVNVGEMSSKAVMEARKWLEEKKSASSSKYKTMITISATSFNLQAIEDGVGSPVDVAKSYMQARHQWGSPAVNNLKFRSPSPAGMHLFKEGTPFPYSSGNFSSSKLKRRSSSSQSWNIHDEIRKVRAKATEDMLKCVSPRSVAKLEPKHSTYVLDASLNVDCGAQGRVGLDDTIISTQGVKPSEDTNTAPQSETDVADDFIQPSSTIGVTTNAVLALGANLDPMGNFCIPKDVFETSKETDEIGTKPPTSNGFPSSSPSSQVAMEGEPKHKPSEENAASQSIAETPGDDITLGNGLDGAMNGENNDSGSSASQNSASTHEEEWLPGDQSLPNSNSASSSPGTSKSLASTRRGRGRGRGRGGRGKGRAAK